VFLLEPGWILGCSPASGATFTLLGYLSFGTASRASKGCSDGESYQVNLPKAAEWPFTIGCLLDADAGKMTVFVNGEPLKKQCKYTFPTDGRAWAPTIGLSYKGDALFSNSV
jgi:hypothetical protein